MTTSHLAPLLADMFEAFASPEAQANGVTFDRETTALWAEALRECIAIVTEQERQIGMLRDELAGHYIGMDLAAPVASAEIIDLEAVLARRSLRPVTTGGTA